LEHIQALLAAKASIAMFNHASLNILVIEDDFINEKGARQAVQEIRSAVSIVNDVSKR
jgi:hypothetical protein